MSFLLSLLNLLPTKMLIRLSVSILKSKGLHRYRDVVILEKITEEFWDLYRKPSLQRRELDGWHLHFRSLSDRFPSMFSPHVSAEEKEVIRHGLTAIRISCWAMRFEGATDQDILDIISERHLSINRGAYHSSHEVFMHRFCRGLDGWPSEPAERDQCISKIKDWCRANVECLEELTDKWRSKISDYQVLSSALA